MKIGIFQRWLLVVASAFLFPSAALAASSDIDFTSIITGKTSINNTNTIIVTIHGIEVGLVVNDGTGIEVGGEDATFDDLNIADFVRIEAFFADEGIVAEAIKVLDSQKEEFRIRGIVQATATSEENVILTVLNIDIILPPDSDITRRGSRSGNDVPAAEILVGDVVNIFGFYEDMELFSRRIHVGNRPQGLIELDGVITALTSDGDTPTSITVLVGETTAATVLIDENSHIGGTLAENVFVEVKGQLDENLTVLGFEIIVDEDGDGDADDDNRRGRGKGKGKGSGMGNSGGNGGDDDGPEIEIEAETSLTAVSGDLKGKAKAKYEEDGYEVEQEFEVEIKDAMADSNYSIKVDFGATSMDFGSFSTDSEGKGEGKFSTSRDSGEVDLTPFVPAGMDIRDITAVRIYASGELVLEGSF